MRRLRREVLWSVIFTLNMNKPRVLIALFATAALGAGTALAVPADWLSYFFYGGALAALIFGSLAAASSQENNQESNSGTAARITLWFVVGTDRPMAQVTDMEALIYFCGSLAYLAGLTVGAFGAVHV